MSIKKNCGVEYCNFHSIDFKSVMDDLLNHDGTLLVLDEIKII
jgi:hypothetical protein